MALKYDAWNYHLNQFKLEYGESTYVQVGINCPTGDEEKWPDRLMPGRAFWGLALIKSLNPAFNGRRMGKPLGGSQLIKGFLEKYAQQPIDRIFQKMRAFDSFRHSITFIRKCQRKSKSIKCERKTRSFFVFKLISWII